MKGPGSNPVGRVDKFGLGLEWIGSDPLVRVGLMWQVAGENFIRRMFFTRFTDGCAQAREALWTRV